MKIDDRILNYSINQNLPKSITDEKNKVEDQQMVDGSKTESKNALEQDTVVQFSKASKEAQLIADVISTEPDIRQEKVDELKAEIESKEYQINHDAVAERIVNHIIDELS